MAGKKKCLPMLEKIEITDVAAEGKAIARVGEWVVFVPWTAPGDIADVQLVRKRSHFAEGRAVFFHRYAPDRIEPFCAHFGTCGGCKWQHLPYEAQLRYKEKQVADSLTRIGKIAAKTFLPIAGAQKTVCYRNKLEFTFSNRRWLTEDEISAGGETVQPNGAGFHIPKMFDKVLDIHKCWLQEDVSNRIRLAVKDYCLSHDGYPFFDLKKQEGFIRTLIIRTSSTGELMVVVVFFEEKKAHREALLHHLKDAFPEITSLMYVINGKCNDTITDQEVILFHGKDHLTEEMEGLRFKIGPKSFFQTNSEQAVRLYRIVRDFAGLTGVETVYDLYTGTGTIANFVARQSGKVIGIEYVPEAVEDARLNAECNGLTNTRFFAGDMKDMLTPSFVEAHGRPDVVITDPPRAGMHDSVIDALLAVSPERIVYVSCNPASQARDLSRLDVLYEVEKVQPVDMFPHTHHVENVALLLKKNNPATT
ncbi:MAG: 23S rRNA (uracil(1939)-C(5))-methyltransferase RlmD [Tannerella sp.]|nr:23S rRNA (uracil(1939)-C(5))-methyltransferase RlmD [Tannerella sp.]